MVAHNSSNKGMTRYVWNTKFWPWIPKDDVTVDLSSLPESIKSKYSLKYTPWLLFHPRRPSLPRPSHSTFEDKLLDHTLVTVLKQLLLTSLERNNVLASDILFLEDLVRAKAISYLTQFTDKLRLAIQKEFDRICADFDEQRFFDFVAVSVESLAVVKAAQLYMNAACRPSRGDRWCRLCDSIKFSDRMVCCILCGDSFHSDCIQRVLTRIPNFCVYQNALFCCSGCNCLIQKYESLHIRVKQNRPCKWYSILFSTAFARRPFSSLSERSWTKIRKQYQHHEQMVGSKKSNYLTHKPVQSKEHLECAAKPIKSLRHPKIWDNRFLVTQ
ncbi:uncharacterized protein LOC126311213 [Schistocerca gregaria]|uniref:uncharacterized protein LOC126311213 n=1 Tax=Schistocerca gregaria TaxID=7010 RepID=UPI00211E37F3|nr:uncharacterized protein LOC126311213 [Schistocerca gregaria]